MDRRSLTLALAGTLVSALGIAATMTPALAADKVKCYGVALKGQNDCAAGAHSCAGQSSMDYDPASFKLVPAGTCETMTTPKGHGMMEPMKG